jgi:hypothetical protein
MAPSYDNGNGRAPTLFEGASAKLDHKPHAQQAALSLAVG